MEIEALISRSTSSPYGIFVLCCDFLKKADSNYKVRFLNITHFTSETLSANLYVYDHPLFKYLSMCIWLIMGSHGNHKSTNYKCKFVVGNCQQAKAWIYMVCEYSLFRVCVCTAMRAWKMHLSGGTNWWMGAEAMRHLNAHSSGQWAEKATRTKIWGEKGAKAPQQWLYKAVRHHITAPLAA